MCGSVLILNSFTDQDRGCLSINFEGIVGILNSFTDQDRGCLSINFEGIVGKVSLSLLWRLSDQVFRHDCLSTTLLRHGFLYYTRTDFMPLADSQKKDKFIQYSCIQFTVH